MDLVLDNNPIQLKFISAKIYSFILCAICAKKTHSNEYDTNTLVLPHGIERESEK